jgi:hypothetical protein
VTSPRSASSTVADIDSCDNISHGEEDNELQDADKNIRLLFTDCPKAVGFLRENRIRL